ncbi:hypothetical protein VTH06DRAFT_263 [Thermothelomyces fergusii]
MSSFAPPRSATEDWTSARPMRKENKKFRSGFGIGIKGSAVERYSRSSVISMPLPQSIDTALSTDSDYVSYEVSAFESLAPWPTLRYSTHMRSGNYTQDGTGVIRRPAPRRIRLTESIPEEILKAHKRVDSLADELSASDLRELMERDQRRRARKRQLEQTKLEMKIAKQAEEQIAAETETEKHGRQPPPNRERGILAGEDVGLGSNLPSATIMPSRPQTLDDLADDRNEASGTDGIPATCENDGPKPLAAFHRADRHSLQPQGSLSEAKEDAPVLASIVSRVTLRNTISRCKSLQEAESRTEQPAPASGGLGGNSAKDLRAWTSFFRWTNRTKTISGGPPSFSNTSRDSMPTPPAPVPPANPIPRRMTSGVPRRTMSRFREDLPELPMSPPASRFQSPEAAAPPSPMKVSTNVPPPLNGKICTSPPASLPKNDTPVSTRPSVEEMRATPSTFSRLDEPGASPEPQSMSLASIDSEGSWFAGGLDRKRRSSVIPERGSGLRRSRYAPSHWDGEQRPEIENPNDDMDITEDDYLSRLTPSHGDRSGWNRKSTGEARPSSDWGEEEAYWASVEGQLPTVVRSQAAGRVKSQQGVLGSFGDVGEITLQRATSVGHDEEHVSY